MAQIIQKIDNLGRRETVSIAAGNTVRVFAGSSAAAPGTRQAVNLTNVDTGLELLVVLTAAGASAPTIATGDFDLAIPPRSTRQLQIGTAIDVWVRGTSATAAQSYAALELL